jgi:Tol biopolymer transport system component
MPDGSQVVFASNRDGRFNLYRKHANVSKQDEVVLKTGLDKTPTSISSDGRYLLYTETDPRTKKDIWVLSNPGVPPGDRKPAPFQRQEFDESEAQFSQAPPTGSSGLQWVAYTSNESGRDEVYVREFPVGPTSRAWPVSKAGGSNPRWRQDGKELFFTTLNGSVMSVEIMPGAAFKASEPKLLVRVPSGIRSNWDVTPDGKRFLVLVNVQQAAPFTVVQNWQAGLKR